MISYKPDGLNQTEYILLNVFSLLTIISGLAAFAGWQTQSTFFITFWSGKIPMAPSTALLFVLFGSVTFIHAKTSQNSKLFRITLIIHSISTAITLLLVILKLFKIHLQIEHLGFNIHGAIGSAPIGYMSIVTAICFLVASGPLTLLFFRNRLFIKTSLLLAFILTISSLILLFGYFIESPLFYNGVIIPPSSNTAFGFLCLGIALLMLGRLKLQSSTEFRRDLLPSISFIFIFSLLSIGILIIASMYQKNFETTFRKHTERELALVASLKVSDIVQWRRERINDGRLLLNNKAFSHLVYQVLNDPKDVTSKEELQSWLNGYMSYRYDQIRLLNTSGESQFVLPDGAPPIPSRLIREKLESIVESGEIAFLDFYKSDNDGHVHLATLIPVYDNQPERNPLGIVMLRINPEVYLYPKIQTWPTASKTAETLLIRKENNEVLFLNKLRFNKESALNLRFPLHTDNLPAALAIKGTRGVIDGLDYRSVQVISDLREIPNSPWFIITKIDKAEVLKPIRDRLLLTITAMIILLAAAAAALGFIYRQQHIDYYRKRLEVVDALRESEEKFSKAFHTSPYAITITEPDNGKFIDVNDGFTRMSGYSKEEAINDSSISLHVWVNGNDRDSVVEELRSGRIVNSQEYRFRNKNGDIITGLFSAQIIILNNKPCILSSILDITDRKNAESALQESEEIFRVIFERSTIGKSMTSPEGIIIKLNNAFAKMLGYTIDEMYQINFSDITHSDDLELSNESIRCLMANERPSFRMEKRYIHKDGSYVWTDVSTTLVRDHNNNPQYFITSIVNITERKLAEAEIQRLNAELEQRVKQRTAQLEASNQELEAFAYSVSHDLRAPLRAVDGFSRILMEEYNSLFDEESMRLFTIIQANTRQMDRLITDLLELARTSRTDMKFSLIDMTSLAQNVYDDIISRQERVKIQFSLSELPNAMGDFTLLRQVWTNLISNAVKYSSRNSHPCIEIGYRAAEDNGEYYVKDNGVGFNQNYEHKLFGVFQRLHKTTEFEGTGIGLAIVQRIVSRHNGQVRGIGELGKGATFYFSLGTKT